MAGAGTGDAEFDPEKFEDKYEHYFPQLQRAYREAFEEMNGEYDSELVHAIDQAVLAESEPFYEGDGRFRVELPEDPVARLAAAGVLVEEDHAERVVEEYADRIAAELRAVFGLDDGTDGGGAGDPGNDGDDADAGDDGDDADPGNDAAHPGGDGDDPGAEDRP